MTPLGGELASSMQLKMLALTEILAVLRKLKLLITEYFMYHASCLPFLVKTTSKFVI